MKNRDFKKNQGVKLFVSLTVEFATIQIKEIFIIELFLKNPNKILILRLSDSPEGSFAIFYVLVGRRLTQKF